MPTGTLIQYTARQPAVSVSSPPSVGPSPRPMAWAAACTLSASRIRRRGTLVVTRATLLAWSIAAPTACTRRQATSAPRPGASAQAADPAVKTTKPYP